MTPPPFDRAERRATATLAAAALALTVLFALPVLQKPEQRLVGDEIIGRHPDAYTYVEHFEAGLAWHSFTQPATDWPAALAAAVWDGVAAYNLVVLATFPLAAWMMFLLARRIGCGRWPAALAALAFAFAPIHLAHTAYHPHVVQIQWIPAVLLALVSVLEAPTWRRLALFVAAVVLMVAANFYALLQLAVLAPVAVLAYWVSAPRGERVSAWRSGAAALGSLAALAAAGSAWLFLRHPEVPAEWRTIGEFSPSDLSVYSARWWSYLLPPDGHPLVGGWVERFWSGHPLAEGKVEHQLYVGIAPLVLAVVAVAVLPWRLDARRRRWIFLLGALAVAGFLFSLPPRLDAGGTLLAPPSRIFHLALPMFRAYARVGILVVLAVLLLAALALGDLFARGGRARAAAVLLTIVGLLELTPLPPWRWHWVLPTAGHRWLASEPGRLQILDCARPTLGEQSINSLMPHPTSILGVFSEPPTEGPVRRFWTDLSILDPVRPVSDCAEPGLAAKLAAMRYTHLLVRSDYRLANRVPQEGLALERTFDDSSVYRIVAAPAAVFTREIEGFYWRAGPPGSTHRWMGPTGTWVVVSRVAEPVDVDLELEIESLERPRQLIVLLGGREFARLDITTGWRRYRLEDLTLEPGANRLTLVPTGRPTVPAAISDSTDHRALTIAVRDWRWNP